MDLNTRARKAVAGVVGDQPVEAIVAFSHMSSVGGATHDGVVTGGSSILGTRYAVDRGIDLADRRLRADLLQSWCAVTSNELVFCKPSQWAVRPKPGDLIDRFDRAGVTLRWTDISGLSTVIRMMHLEFPNSTHLLTATLVRSRIKKTNYNDEPDLFVQAFGSAATRLADA